MRSDDRNVCVYEVGPRDGLQNEKIIIPTAQKIALIDALSRVGFRKIEATSFVSPKWVPQLADASDVMSGIARVPNVQFSALTPNLKGFERAIDAGVDEVAIFASASETFSQKNINCSIEESLARFVPILKRAKTENIPVRGYVSCIVKCPYEGDIKPQAVANVAAKLLVMGCYEISLGDTIGAGSPETITSLLEEVIRHIPAVKLAGHFHDTHDNAIQNVRVALDYGLRTFDSAVGGLGGCPYAPGAKGNLSTSVLVNMLKDEGWQSGLNLQSLADANQFLQQIISRFPPSDDIVTGDTQ